jgi:hypothetical protein
VRRRLFQVFSSALKLLAENMCTSSIRYTLKRPRTGAKGTLSSSSRVCSTLVREAASTSSRSTKRPSSISRQAGTDAAGLGADALLAVQRLGEDAGQGGLTDAAGAGEQIGVMQLAALEAVDQRLHHMPLADQVAKDAGAICVRVPGSS